MSNVVFRRLFALGYIICIASFAPAACPDPCPDDSDLPEIYPANKGIQAVGFINKTQHTQQACCSESTLSGLAAAQHIGLHAWGEDGGDEANGPQWRQDSETCKCYVHWTVGGVGGGAVTVEWEGEVNFRVVGTYTLTAKFTNVTNEAAGQTADSIPDMECKVQITPGPYYTPDPLSTPERRRVSLLLTRTENGVCYQRTGFVDCWFGHNRRGPVSTSACAESVSLVIGQSVTVGQTQTIGGTATFGFPPVQSTIKTEFSFSLQETSSWTISGTCSAAPCVFSRVAAYQKFVIVEGEATYRVIDCTTGAEIQEPQVEPFDTIYHLADFSHQCWKHHNHNLLPDPPLTYGGQP
jgi:hypothetical protein